MKATANNTGTVIIKTSNKLKIVFVIFLMVENHYPLPVCKEKYSNGIKTIQVAI